MSLKCHWIDDHARLAGCCRHWRQSDFIALDTEFMRVDTFYPIAGLIQVAIGDEAYLIDPLRISDWTDFSALLDDPDVLKVVHSASEDLEVLLHLTGHLPSPLFDTQVAAAYLGIGHSMGYSRLVQAVLGLQLAKDETRSDWLQRPLTDMQLRYAAADVVHLVELFQALDARLDEQRRGWLLADGAERLTAAGESLPPEEAYRDVKLAWKLDPRRLAVLRELCAWREVEARRRNIPRSRLLKDRSLWPLARSAPKDITALAKIEDMHPRTLRQDGTTLLALIAQARASDPASWPEPLPEPLPLAAGDALKRLRAVGQREAERLGLAPELMLRKKVLESLLRSGWPNGPYQLPDSLTGWRRERMGEALLASLAS